MPLLLLEFLIVYFKGVVKSPRVGFDRRANGTVIN